MAWKEKIKFVDKEFFAWLEIFSKACASTALKCKWHVIIIEIGKSEQKWSLFLGIKDFAKIRHLSSRIMKYVDLNGFLVTTKPNFITMAFLKIFYMVY